MRVIFFTPNSLRTEGRCTQSLSRLGLFLEVSIWFWEYLMREVDELSALGKVPCLGPSDSGSDCHPTSIGVIYFFAHHWFMLLSLLILQECERYFGPWNISRQEISKNKVSWHTWQPCCAGSLRNILSFTGWHWTHPGCFAVFTVHSDISSEGEFPRMLWLPGILPNSLVDSFIYHLPISQGPKTSSEWHNLISTSDLALKIPCLKQMPSKPQRTSWSWLSLESP